MGWLLSEAFLAKKSFWPFKTGLGGEILFILLHF
jgi:hypothetical protein